MKHRVRVVRGKMAAGAATVLISALALLLAAGGTAFAGTSGTHNNAYSYSALMRDPSTSGSLVIANEYNDQSVTMLCFVDGQNVTDRQYSNYNSARWFRIRDAANRAGYIHSSYVYNQTSVGRC